MQKYNHPYVVYYYKLSSYITYFFKFHTSKLLVLLVFHSTVKLFSISKFCFQLDDKIKEMVLPFLYNNGEGRKVPIQELVITRNKERPKHRQLPQNRDADSKATAKSSAINIETISKEEGIYQSYFASFYYYFLYLIFILQ